MGTRWRPRIPQSAVALGAEPPASHRASLLDPGRGQYHLGAVLICRFACQVAGVVAPVGGVVSLAGGMGAGRWSTWWSV
jgi:hypothetical protein